MRAATPSLMFKDPSIIFTFFVSRKTPTMTNLLYCHIITADMFSSAAVLEEVEGKLGLCNGTKLQASLIPTPLGKDMYLTHYLTLTLTIE